MDVSISLSVVKQFAHERSGTPFNEYCAGQSFNTSSNKLSPKAKSIPLAT